MQNNGNLHQTVSIEIVVEVMNLLLAVSEITGHSAETAVYLMQINTGLSDPD